MNAMSRPTMQMCSLSWNTLKRTYQTCMTMWVNVMCVQFWYAHVYALIHMNLMTMWKTRNSLYALTVRPESFRVRGPHPQHLTHCELSMTAMWNKWDSLKIISSNTMRFTYCEYANTIVWKSEILTHTAPRPSTSRSLKHRNLKITQATQIAQKFP